jgi:hypothetical protein
MVWEVWLGRALKHMPEWEEISVVTMAVHNMHLMACSLGCQWSSDAIRQHPHVAQFLELHSLTQLLVFSMWAYRLQPAQWLAPSRRCQGHLGAGVNPQSVWR